jgi:competence protein ComFC
MNLKDFILDIIFPKFCFFCQKEGDYLCEDCLATLEISQGNFCLCENPINVFAGGKCRKCSSKKLDGLYFALPYQNKKVKNLIHQFKYEPFVKELAEPLASLIITYFQLAEKEKDFKDFIIIPVPLERKRLKWRGFNQSEEIGKKLADFFQIPLFDNVLLKIKETKTQVELDGETRKENLKKVFTVENKDSINNKKILLIDDVYTTGATMEECARTLKEAGAKEVMGVAVARAKPEEDKVGN